MPTTKWYGLLKKNMSSSKSPYEKVLEFWSSKNQNIKIDCPFLSFSTAGNVWETFNSLIKYLGARNHFLFESHPDEEYFIDSNANLFIVKFDIKRKINYPEFIKVISKEELLQFVKDSEINEQKNYETMESFEEIFKNLISEKFSYY
ncbi:MAG: hypothetical protein NVV82_11135 [Sporocytophaga sp.]|nr:hypothetical protein [Sporocytophaga sp.]